MVSAPRCVGRLDLSRRAAWSVARVTTSVTRRGSWAGVAPDHSGYHSHPPVTGRPHPTHVGLRQGEGSSTSSNTPVPGEWMAPSARERELRSLELKRTNTP